MESDLPYVSGDDFVDFSDGSATKDYALTIIPMCSGTYSGTVAFTAPNGQYLWHSIEVQKILLPLVNKRQIKASKPAPEATIPISCAIRKAVVVEISIRNPHTTQPVEFDIATTGSGLLGDPTIIVNPQQIAIYQLVFSPCTLKA